MAEQDPGGQPPDRPPTYDGPFLFVNKNAANLNSKQREDVFAVRSHAMQIARRSRKPSSPTKLQERTTKTPADPQHPETPPTQGSTESPTPEPIPSIQEFLEQQALGVRQYQQGQSRIGEPTQSQRQSVAHPQPGNSPSLVVPLGASLSPTARPGLLPVEHAAALSQLTVAPSPTGVIPGAPDTSTGPLPPNFFNSVLQFWKLGYMSNFWPAHIYLSHSHKAVQFTDEWIRGMVLANPALLHGLFSGALSYITNYLPPTENTPMLWARAIHHYGRCLEETRTQMARPGISTEQALSLVHGMTTFSFHCQDLESCQVHRTASMRLLQALEGGLESIHPVLKYLLVLCDSLIASHVPKRPSVDVDSWAPKPWAEEASLRTLDSIFTFEAGSSRQTDTTVFLLDNDVQMDEYAEDLLELINWHREALAANDLAFKLAHTSPAASPDVMDAAPGDGRRRADPIYTWLSLRQYALSCLCSDMFVDFLEMDDEELSLLSQLYRVYHSCVLLATSYLFQFIMRRDMDSPSLAYIPYHHLRTRLELLMALMSRYRRTPASPPEPSRRGRGAVNPIPTDGLLFLFFAGALGEVSDGPRRVRAADHVARGGVIGSSQTEEHPGHLINESWFSVHFAMILQRLDIDTWESAQKILKRFVYAERVLDGFLQILVARKLEVMTTLVARVPVNPPAVSNAFFGGPGGPHAAMQGVDSSSLPPGSSPRPALQVPAPQVPSFRQPSMPGFMRMPLSGAAPILNPGQASETLSLLGPTPVSLSAAVPGAAADWWQDLRYDLGGEEEFSLDLDAYLNMGSALDALPGLQNQGEGFSDQDDTAEG